MLKTNKLTSTEYNQEEYKKKENFIFLSYEIMLNVNGMNGGT